MNRRPDQTTSAWHTFAATAGFFSGTAHSGAGEARAGHGRTNRAAPTPGCGSHGPDLRRAPRAALRAANPHARSRGRRSGRRDPHLTPAARAVQPAEGTPDPAPRLSVETGQRLSRYTTQAHDVYSVAGLSSAPGALSRGPGRRRGGTIAVERAFTGSHSVEARP